MKSIRTRLVISYAGAILGLFLVMSAVGIYYLTMAIDTQSAQSMQLLSEEKTEELNTYFLAVERAVNSMSDNLSNTVDVEQFQSSSEYRKQLYQSLERQSAGALDIIESALSVYYRPDPELYGGTAGFFLAENSSGQVQSLTPTNILEYEADDTAHVGWYYQPIENGSEMWMEPYTNENIGVYIISYVTPVYIGNVFLGVYGMDIDMTLVHQSVDQLYYENSTASLFSSGGNLLYHQDYTGGLDKSEFTEEIQAQSEFFKAEYINTGRNYQYSVGSKQYRIIVTQLDNGMYLAISTPEASLYRMCDHMVFQILLIFVVAIVLVVAVSVRLTHKIVTPIRDLTVISSRIAKGELGQEIAYQSHDEIGSLADSIRKISVELKKYIDYINAQAYVDAMTGVRNKAAYMAEEARLEHLIKEQMASFTIYVFDVNGLKRMNDTKGHEYGDLLIKNSAQCIRAIFGNGVYRIGGDEFVVLTEKQSDDEIQRQFARFDEQLRFFNTENSNYEEELAISKGAASYDPEKDIDFASVFSRADEEMYQCKAKYYQLHQDRRRQNE